MAKCKMANYNQTIVQRELKALCLGVQIGKKASEILKIKKENVHYYTDNTIILDQLGLCSSKGPTSVDKGNALACMEVLKEINIENIHFIPSELNSSDKLTRPQKTEEIFDADSNWFIPNEALNVEGVPHFERFAMRRLSQKEQNAMIEIERQDVESCNVLQEIRAINLENYAKVKFCQ